jgi:hypothetical protein
MEQFIIIEFWFVIKLILVIQKFLPPKFIIIHYEEKSSNQYEQDSGQTQIAALPYQTVQLPGAPL